MGKLSIANINFPLKPTRPDDCSDLHSLTRCLHLTRASYPVFTLLLDTQDFHLWLYHREKNSVYHFFFAYIIKCLFFTFWNQNHLCSHNASSLSQINIPSLQKVKQTLRPCAFFLRSRSRLAGNRGEHAHSFPGQWSKAPLLTLHNQSLYIFSSFYPKISKTLQTASMFLLSSLVEWHLKRVCPWTMWGALGASEFVRMFTWTGKNTSSAKMLYWYVFFRFRLDQSLLRLQITPFVFFYLTTSSDEERPQYPK